MNWLYQPLMILLAKGINSELAKRVEKRCIVVTKGERSLLLKLGEGIGRTISSLSGVGR
jgi:hypothetical protein